MMEEDRTLQNNAEGCERNNDDHSILRKELLELKEKNNKLTELNIVHEKEFSQKRAMFMDLFRQKEDDVRRLSETLKIYEEEKKILQENFKKLKQDLDDAKTALTIAEVSQEDELVRLRQRHQEEVSSLQHIMRESIAQIKQSESERFEQLQSQWTEQHEEMVTELQELRNKLNQEREGFLASIAKTLQKKVAAAGIVPSGSSTASDNDNLEDSMRKAQEGTEILRSVVLPLEEEINKLRQQLAYANQKLESSTHSNTDLTTIRVAHDVSDLPTSADVSLLGSSFIPDDSLCSYRGDGDENVSALSRSRSSQSLASVTKELLSEDNSPLVSPGPVHMDKAAGRSVANQMASAGSRDTESPLADSKAARDKRCCDMCANYEAQLQTVQEVEKKSQDKIRTLERQIQVQQESFSNQQKYIAELEASLKQEAENFQAEVSNQQMQVEKMASSLQSISTEFTHTQEELHSRLKLLTEKRAEVEKELRRLQEENNNLVGKHSKTAEQLQTENINFPDNVEELQILLLRYREDLITSKVAQLHCEETLRSEILFLKDQVLAEQQEKSNLEDTLTAEIRQLHDNLETQKYKLQSEMDARVKEKESQLHSQQTQYQQKMRELEGKFEEISSIKIRQDTDMLQLRGKIHTLQIDLENSEAVQRDFVKLSQSLQIELEKIRASEHEVRWQYEEDVDDCRSCRQPFTVTRRKHHCRHCGKIFCADCVTKTIPSGPHQRPSKVCDVCHTILDRQATPYFSVEPPKTPD